MTTGKGWAMNRREALTWQLDLVTEAIANCESLRDLAALSRERRALLNELEAIPDLQKVSAVDEIASRRAARQAITERPSRTRRNG